MSRFKVCWRAWVENRNLRNPSATQTDCKISASSAATDQTTNKVSSNEIGLALRIEEILGRLAYQTSDTVKTEAEPLNFVPFMISLKSQSLRRSIALEELFKSLPG